MPDRNRKQNTRKLAVSAVMISLSAALSVIKVAQMPLGGSDTLQTMLPHRIRSKKNTNTHQQKSA